MASRMNEQWDAPQRPAALVAEDDSFAWESLPGAHRSAALRMVRQARRQRRARLIALLLVLVGVFLALSATYWALWVRA